MNIGDQLVASRAKRGGIRLSPDARRALAQAVLAQTFPAQRDAIEDPSRYIGLSTPRQAGKSATIERKILTAVATGPADALYSGATESYYVAESKEDALRILWRRLKDLDARYAFKGRYYESDGFVEWPWGSTLEFGGAKDEGDADHWRGPRPHLFIVDEIRNIQPRIADYLLGTVLPPGLNTRRGQLFVASTPARVARGAWYRISGPTSWEASEDDAGVLSATSRPFWRRHEARWNEIAWSWSLHRWTLRENTFEPHLWEEALATKRMMAWQDDHPTWRREFLGEWAPDDSELVYVYDEGLNLWLPSRNSTNPFGLPPGRWNFGISGDLGHKDPFALGVLAWSEELEDDEIYLCHEVCRPKLGVGEIAKHIRAAEAQIAAYGADPYFYEFDLDNLGGTIMQTLVDEHSILISRAEKKQKPDAQELLNEDLKAGRVKIAKGFEIVDEMTNLVKDELGRELKSLPNHRCDMLLYGYRRARALRSAAKAAAAHNPPPRRLPPGVPGVRNSPSDEDDMNESVGKRRRWYEL